MRIVQINGGAKGSTGKIMMGIAEVARQQGHEVMCASPITTTNRDAGKDCGYYRIGTFNSRRINVALARITGFNGCFAWIETYKLLKKINEFKPDIIHLHNLHDSYINLPMLFSYIKEHKVPVVWTLHDCWSFTGQCPHFTMVKCSKWKTGCNSCPQYKEYPSSLYDNTKKMWKLKKKWFTGIENMAIVTPSQWLANLVKESYLKEYPVKVINNGIDLLVFKPTPYDGLNNILNCTKTDNRYVILGVAFDWGRRKGLDVFIKLSQSLPTDLYRIVLIGTNDYIDSQLPKDIVSIHRTQDQHQLAEIYTMSDVFVIPTREENYPTVNLEALSCGTPVITFNTGGSSEMLDEETGIIVDVDDVEAIKRAIEDVCEKKKCSNRDYIVKYSKKFDMRNKFTEYIKLYSDIIER